MKLVRVLEWAAVAALGALGWLTPAAAQAPPPLPAPDLGLVVAGTVSAVARQADGGLLIGGNFAYVDGQPRGNIARIRPDGTLDPDWHPQVTNTINTLAVNPSTGAVYVGGFLTAVDGVARSRLAKLDGTTGALDPAWNPAPNSTVSSLVVDPVSGAVFAGGAFATIGSPSVARLGLAKIDGAGSGAIDATWTPAAKAFSSVNAMALTSGGALYVGGTFTTITSAGSSTATTRNYLARIDATSGVLDADWNPSAGASVAALALDPATGDVYAGGSFTTIGVPAVSRQRLAKIGGAGIGAVDATFSAAAGSSVYALAFDPAENTLYVGGAFTTLAGSGDPATTPRLRLGKFNAVTGALDSSWNPAASGTVSALTLGAAGKVLAAGSFGAIGTTTCLSLATLAATDGALTACPDVGTKGSVSTLARQSNGGLIVGGNFLRAGAAARTHVLRLKPDGTLDPDFKPVLSGNVSKLAIGAGDAVYLTGFFTSVDGVARQNIAKLDAGGTLASGWNVVAALSGPAAAMIESGGALYLGGSFTMTGASRLVKLDAATGDRDTNWAPSPNSQVNALALDATAGALYVGGAFASIGGASRSYLAKLDLATGAATAWNPVVNSSVATLALDDGALYAGGGFVTATVGGTPGVARNRLVKIDAASGDVDPTWNPGSSTNVVALAAGGGALFVAAGSGTVGGETRAYLSKIGVSGAGIVDPLWNPSPDAQVNALDAGASVSIGGTFTTAGGASRLALAALPTGIPSTTTITSVQPATTVVGESYTVSVDVSVPGGSASGAVTIDDGNGVSCSAPLSGGSGSCTLASAAAGTHTITASHAGGSGYAASSTTASHLVGPAATTTAISAPTPVTAVYGESVSVGFTLAVNAPGAGAPGGTVNVLLDGGAGCAAPAATGSCTIAAGTLGAGAYTLVAGYAGDADFSASSSASQSLTVSKAASTTTLLSASPASATTGQPVTVNYAVGGAGTPAGSVSVVASSGETCNGAVAAGQCQITFTTPGTRTLTAAYAGDANHDGSTSPALAYTVGTAEVWIEGQKLTPPDGNSSGYFGAAAAVRGDVALVGSEYANVNGIARRGAVYVFHRVNGSWTQVQKLVSGDGGTDHLFGGAIIIDGTTALIGARGATVNGASGAGAVYVFSETDGVWAQTQKLTSVDPYPAANFGNALSLSGDRVVIGAQNLTIVGRAYQGAAYLFSRSSGTWSQTQKIIADDGAASSYFGTSIAFDGGTLAITAPSATIGAAARQGAVYVFSEAAPGQWAQVQKLTSSDGYAQQHFGASVAVSGDRMLVGTPSAAINGLNAAGAVYAFGNGGSGWSEAQKLTSSNIGASYNFGQRVVLRGDAGFVGESYAAVGGVAQAGAVHAVRWIGGQWSVTSTLTASDGQLNNWFGWSIGWDGATAVIGAIGVTYVPNAYQGAVYFFRPDALFSDGFE